MVFIRGYIKSSVCCVTGIEDKGYLFVKSENDIELSSNFFSWTQLNNFTTSLETVKFWEIDLFRCWDRNWNQNWKI